MANTAIRVFLQDMGAAYDEERGPLRRAKSRGGEKAGPERST